MRTTVRFFAVAALAAAGIFGADAQAATPSAGQPLVSQLTGLCLTSVTNPDGSTVVQQQPCRGTLEQQWRLRAVAGTTLYFYVTDDRSGKCLDILPGGQIVQNPCDSTPTQRWTLSPDGGSGYLIVSVVNWLSALQADGGTVRLGVSLGAQAQSWSVTRTPEPLTNASFQSQDRGTYWIGEYAIANPDKVALRDWVLQFDLPAGAWMGSYWNGVATAKGTHVTVRPVPGNSTVAAGDSTTPNDFGFAALGVPRTPANCTINGRPCAGPRPLLAPVRASLATANQVTLAWQASAEPVSQYELARDGVVIARLSAQSTSYVDTGLASGASYIYQVREWGPDGRVSAFSPAVTVTTAT